MPFQFGRFEDKYLMVNESGEYHFIDYIELSNFIKGDFTTNSPDINSLKSKQFMVTGDLSNAVNMIATRYRTRKHFISSFTTLHMMVLTVRCNQDCKYCQVSAESDTALQYDMSPDVAKKSVEMAFNSPSNSIKIEFQGGEPSLNWNALTSAIEHAKFINKSKKKRLEFVICTNLTNISTDKLSYLKENGVYISTSLDGPKYLHDKNRILRSGGGTYDIFHDKLKEARSICGYDAVSALMTTTIDNIENMNEVVDEYIRLGFNGIFLRSLNPYGLAAENSTDLGYSIKCFTEKFKDTLDYIIELNLKGVNFSEYFTTLLLSRILTPFSTGFVDLQSPSGAGIAGVIYDYNGDVYPADEARMLARMGDAKFKMGNVFVNSYNEIFGGSVLREIVSKSIVEIMPGCSTCMYKTYCGADPIRNYLEYGDLIGKRPGSSFCEKNMAIFDILFKKLKENDSDTLDVFWAWITRRPLKEVRLEGI